jgi:hypothetical protein
MFSPVRRVLAVVALAAALALPLCGPDGRSSATVAPAEAAPASLGLAAQLRTWLCTIWPALGCGLDPDGYKMAAPGRARQAPARGTRPDLGCTIDPNGCRI